MRVAPGDQRVGLGIIQRQVREIDLHAARLEQRNRLLQHIERLQSEKVEFYQPRQLDPFHIELRRRHVRARIAIQGHQFDQRPIADHHARGMGRGVAVEAFELQRDIDQLRDGLVAVAQLLQRRLAVDRLREA